MEDFDLKIDLTTFDLDLDADLDLAFGLEECDDSLSAVETAIHVSRYPRHKPHLVKYERAAELAAMIPELDEGMRVAAIVSGNFIFGDFIEAYMVQTNYFAEEILVATLSLGKENVDSLHNLVQGGFCDDLALIVSDYWYAHERRKEGGVPYILETLGQSEKFRLAAAGLHTKVTLIRTSCGKHIVMHGSANLRSSRNLEQFVIENDPDLYAFHRAWMEQILGQFQAKSKRGDQLWQLLTGQTKKPASPAGRQETPPPASATPNVNK